jgi:uncharacterized membrane protein (DUF485 family)
VSQDDVTARVRANPKYMELVNARNTYGWIMTALMMIAYFGYILLIAFNKAWLGTKIGEGYVTSIGIPLGLGVIAFTIVITWIYVRRANSEFDDLKDAVVKEAFKK